MQGQILREQGRPDEAMALFQSLRDGSPGNPAGHDGMRTVHMSRGNLSAAREKFEKALGLDLYDTSALENARLRSDPGPGA